MKMLYLIVLLLTASVGQAFAYVESTDRGNGGDEISQSFVEVGYKLVESLMKDPVAGVDTEALLQAVKATRVFSEERLVLRGTEVDAINYPDPQSPRILVSRSRWAAMEKSSHRRVFLAFHEYLGIMGLDDSSYQISSRLDRAKVCERSPEVRKSIEKTLKKSCYRIIEDDLQFVTALYLKKSAATELFPRDLIGLGNIDYLNFMDAQVSEISTEAWEMLPNLESLWISSSFEPKGCAFLRTLPKIKTLLWGKAAYETEHANHLPIKELPPACLAGLKLTSLNVNVDGNTTKLTGFLGDVSLRGLSISGVNIENIPVAELAATGLRSVSLSDFEKPFSKKYIDELAAKTGLSCQPQERRDLKGEKVFSAFCYMP